MDKERATQRRELVTVWTCGLWLFIGAALHAQPLPEPVLKVGFPRQLHPSGWLSIGTVVPCDLDNDGIEELISAAGTHVYVVRADGENFPGWPQDAAERIFEAPAVGDLDGDGWKEIVAKAFSPHPTDTIGWLFAWRRDGSPMSGFPISLGFQAWGGGALSGPALYDIAGDGRLEIVVAASSRVWIITADGQLLTGWPQRTEYRTVLSQPLVADMTGDGSPEIMVASGDADPVYVCAIDAWDAGGRRLPGWPFRDSTNINPTRLGAIGPLGPNGALALAFGTTRPAGGSWDQRFYILNAQGGVMSGWPAPMFGGLWVDCGVSLVDVSSFGIPQIASSSMYQNVWFWYHSGQLLPHWPFALPLMAPFIPYARGTPMIYRDIQSAEFVLFIANNIMDDSTSPGVLRGYLYAIRHDSTQMPWSPMRPIGWIRSTPAFSDIDRDGSVEMMVLTSPGPYGGNVYYLYVWEFPGIPFTKERFPWPLALYNRWHTGQYGFEPFDTTVVSVPGSSSLPTTFRLEQNYPNPFNSSTMIEYEIPRTAAVTITVYNILGQEVTTLLHNEIRHVGRHRVRFNARSDFIGAGGLPTGIYVYRMQTYGFIQSKKMLYMK